MPDCILFVRMHAFIGDVNRYSYWGLVPPLGASIFIELWLLRPCQKTCLRARSDCARRAPRGAAPRRIGHTARGAADAATKYEYSADNATEKESRLMK